MHDEPPAIDLLEHRPETGIPEIAIAVIGHQADAVALERLHRVPQFREACLDVRERQCREEAEPLRVIDSHLRRELITGPSQALRETRVVKPDARRAD